MSNRESRETNRPFFDGVIAQLVERLPVKQDVGGPSPSHFATMSAYLSPV